MYKCQHDFQADQFQFKELHNVFDFEQVEEIVQSCCKDSEENLGMDNKKLCMHKRRGCTICQFKTNTSLKVFVWFYALINGVSARGDIYSSSEVWVGKNVIFFYKQRLSYLPFSILSSKSLKIESD